MTDDVEGPIIGWSLGTGLERRPIDDLVEFPCTYAFKVVGVAEGDFVPALLGRVGRVLGRDVRDDETRVRESAQGRYQSVTLEIFVTSGDQVYSIYEAMHADARVRFVF